MLYGVTIDVTEAHRTMQALSEANERAALAVRAAGMGTWQQDLATLPGCRGCSSRSATPSTSISARW